MRSAARLRAAAVLGVLALAATACGTAPAPPARQAATAVAPLAGLVPGVPEPTPAAAPWGSALHPVRIMPLGDSITLGRGDRRIDGYRRELGTLLASAAVRHDFVGSQSDGTGADNDHEGHSGWTIAETRGRIHGWLSSARPDVILLDLGTNDLLQGYDPVGAGARLADLIDTILASSPDVRVVLATLVITTPAADRPVRPSRARAAPLLLTYNTEVRRIAAARAPRVRLAEMAGVRGDETRDGVHPLPRGYRKMARRWYRQLGLILPGGATWPAPPPLRNAARKSV